MEYADGFDALIRAALHEIVREDWEEIESDPQIPRVSSRYRKRVERMLRGESSTGRGSRVARKVVLGLLAALCAAAMLGMAIRPVREAVVRAVITWYDTHFGVRYEAQPEEPETVPTTLKEVILPTWLPDGWTVRELSVNLIMADHILSGEDGEKIHLSQHPIDPDEETDWFDDTDVTVERVPLNGATEAVLFSYADGRRTLTWADRYAFVMSWPDEDADAELLIKIAQSMKANHEKR